MNRQQRRASAAMKRKSFAIIPNSFAPGGLEPVERGSLTGSNRSRPLKKRTKKGAN